MIRICRSQDMQAMQAIINAAATVYDGHIPSDCYHQPYMPREELKLEMQRMTFLGWEESGKLIAVMGSEQSKDVTLLRHAYTLPEHQGKGIGSRLLERIVAQTKTSRLLVGTWADATWAVSFYQRHGFTLLADKDALLKIYWNIPQRQIDTSVVLGKNIVNFV